LNWLWIYSVRRGARFYWATTSALFVVWQIVGLFLRSMYNVRTCFTQISSYGYKLFSPNLENWKKNWLFCVDVKWMFLWAAQTAIVESQSLKELKQNLKFQEPWSIQSYWLYVLTSLPKRQFITKVGNIFFGCWSNDKLEKLLVQPDSVQNFWSRALSCLLGWSEIEIR
jgi:hypothetical protein